jgi:uncharacterized protein (UPF0332 family)
VARDGDDVLSKAVGEIAYALSLEHSVLLCEHVVSAWRFAQMHARQELIYKNVTGEGVDLWPLTVKPFAVAEERTSYQAGSDEDYGIHEDYLKERLERAYEDLADAHRALDVGSHRLALNRAYYAVFHIATAALALLGQERYKHSAVESAFHEYLIRPGFIEPEYGVFYKEARELARAGRLSLQRQIHRGEDARSAGESRAHRRLPGTLPARAWSFEE